ncbi:MAG: GNAT family N-acetyltransferase [Anaerolineae bacterium]|nr:GNAT family N-acetyltransferase [Anaerolineae bacterium]
MPANSSSLHVTAHPSREDIAFLEQRIIEHNYARANASDGNGLAAFVRGENGEILAGIAGYTWAGMAEIEFLWVHDQLRGQGIGAQLLAAVEEEARSRGCALIITSTYSFQAPQFYQRNGYEITGKIENCPPGHTNYWLKKDL